MYKKETIYITPFKDERTLHIYYPDKINRRKLPGVLYMFDGHNLFLDEDATYGKSWGLKKYLDKHPLNMMIVGLECSHKGNRRLQEFSPYSFNDDLAGSIKACGKPLMKWMTTGLKNYIESNYAVSSNPKKTAIAGSSMGGLMALYAGIAYPNVYTKAACLSPFVAPVYQKLVKDVNQQENLKKSQFYISWGANEFFNKEDLALQTSLLTDMNCRLLKKQASVYSHCYLKGEHNEASWEKEIKTFLKELEIE